MRRLEIDLQPGDHIVFTIPFPKSYNLKKQRKLDGQPHISKPDIDNLLKSLLDALYKDDSHVWHIGSLKKLWGRTGSIEIING